VHGPEQPQPPCRVRAWGPTPTPTAAPGDPIGPVANPNRPVRTTQSAPPAAAWVAQEVTRARRSPGYACSRGQRPGRWWRRPGCGRCIRRRRGSCRPTRGVGVRAQVGGYRALGHVVGGGLVLRSRNGVDVGGWFPELAGLAGALGDHAGVLDGEVVAFDGDGRPSFGRCRGGWSTGPGGGGAGRHLPGLRPCVAGRPAAHRPALHRVAAAAGGAGGRRARLADGGVVRRGRHRPAGGHPRTGPGGVVAERLQSIYLPGRRTRNWLKTKHYQRETFLVGGFVPDRDQVRSLLVGLPDPARPGRPRPGPGGPAAGPRAARAAGHPGEPVRRARGGPAGGRRGPAGTRRPDPGVRPPRGRRRGQLPRLGVGPPPPPCLRRPDPATVEPRTSRRRRQ
jgi:bifunctional non-homologous end joining protein LigD